MAIKSIKIQMLDEADLAKKTIHQQAIRLLRRYLKGLMSSTPSTKILRVLEKTLLGDRENLSFIFAKSDRRFQPSVISTLHFPNSPGGFNYGGNIYNQKTNMLITCPSTSTAFFYNANDFTPMKRRMKKELNSTVIQMSYWPANNTYLMACAFGDVYRYNASTHTMHHVLREGCTFLLAIAQINAKTFAFSSYNSDKLYFGNLETGETVAHSSKGSDAWYLLSLPKEGLLFSGLGSGKVVMYNTRKDQRFPIAGSLQAHETGKCVNVVKSVNIKGKEYIITGGNDKVIKIWHYHKGKLRLLKVIRACENTYNLAYLENYKMIASTHNQRYIKFFKLMSGKSEGVLDVGLKQGRNIFPMADKNMLGVADLNESVIKIVQLHPR